jgi:hypothetical protein
LAAPFAFEVAPVRVWCKSERTPSVSSCQSRYTEQVDSIVLRFTAEDVVAMAAD